MNTVSRAPDARDGGYRQLRTRNRRKECHQLTPVPCL